MQGRAHGGPAVRSNEDIYVDVESGARLAVIANGHRTADGMGDLGFGKTAMRRDDLVWEREAAARPRANGIG